MDFMPSNVAVWCLVTGVVGLATHAHDLMVLWASRKLRPQGVFDWAIAVLGFSWTFAKWSLGGLLLWAIWNEPALHYYAIGGIGAAVLVWGVLELGLDLAMTSKASEYRPFVWIYSLRKLISFLWWGLGFGTALWLVVLVVSE